MQLSGAQKASPLAVLSQPRQRWPVSEWPRRPSASPEPFRAERHVLRTEYSLRGVASSNIRLQFFPWILFPCDARTRPCHRFFPRVCQQLECLEGGPRCDRTVFQARAFCQMSLSPAQRCREQCKVKDSLPSNPVMPCQSTRRLGEPA